MTQPPSRIELQAVDPVRNIHRRYDIEWGRDLLGDWVVETQWGRIGGCGRRKVEIFQDEATAAAAVDRHLKRRNSSPRRIGVRYAPIASSPAPPRQAEICYSTRLRHYLWIDGFDGWVEDEDAAILAVHPGRGQFSNAILLASARQTPTTYAWGLYVDGTHLAGKALCISQWWAEEDIRQRKRA